MFFAQIPFCLEYTISIPDRLSVKDTSTQKETWKDDDAVQLNDSIMTNCRYAHFSFFAELATITTTKYRKTTTTSNQKVHTTVLYLTVTKTPWTGWQLLYSRVD